MMTGTPTSFCTQRYPDDPSISGSTELLRRIPPAQIIFDQNLQRHRPTSQAFRDDLDEDPMSVYLSSILAHEGRPPSAVLAGHDGFALASVTAQLARSLSQTVHPDPLPDETSHAVVCGNKESGGKNAPRKRFAEAAVWVVAPPNKSSE
jgi:hypothetical protein